MKDTYEISQKYYPKEEQENNKNLELKTPKRKLLCELEIQPRRLFENRKKKKLTS